MPRAIFDVRVSRTRALRYHRKHLGATIPDLPWGSLDPGRYPPLLVERARIAWTENAFNELCTAAALAQMMQAMIIAQVPLDLWSMASGFAGDEIVHVELCSRIAVALGGGAPIEYDDDDLVVDVTPGLSWLERANELVVRICCVGEALSVPLLTGAANAATHPLTRGVLRQIVRDEGPHGAFGDVYLDWAAPRMSAEEKRRLGRVAAETIIAYEPIWMVLRGGAVDGVTPEGFALEHVHELGWMEAGAYQALALATVEDAIRAPLARHGIVVPPDKGDRRRSHSRRGAARGDERPAEKRGG